MSKPARAAVRPMVYGRFGGPAIPLESVVERMLRAKARGLVLVSGEPCSGRSTAVDHLRAVFTGDPDVKFLDEPQSRELIHASARQLMVFTGTLRSFNVTTREGNATLQTPEGPLIPLLDSFVLAPWGQDQWIELTLARHPDGCRSILARALQPENARFMGGSPLLATLILSTFATEPAENSAKNIVRQFLRTAEPKQACQKDIATIALNFMFGGNPEPCLTRLIRAVQDWRVIQLLQLPAVQALIATDRVIHDLCGRSRLKYLVQRFRSQLIRGIADALESNVDAYDRLVQIIDAKDELAWHGTVAAILVAAGQGWKPTASTVLDLSRADLSGAAWHRARLGKCKLDDADLSSADLREAEMNNAGLLRANLSGANLEQAMLNNAHLQGTDLRGARLVRAAADGARFGDADLTGADFNGAQLHGAWLNANLTRTRFVRANLSCATFKGATLDDTDFTGACLESADMSGLDLRSAEFSGAVLAEAYLARSRLDGQHMPGVNLRKANLSQADLTGSCLSHADLSGADLRGAGLAEIEWERADLSGADLRNCSFHAGSSRSGLVDSVIASEGTRTGFYTDEYDEQLYRPVEEIRKANLRGADLRGANVEHTDFYLVDLRDAKFDAEQEAHFRRCGAILETRV